LSACLEQQPRPLLVKSVIFFISDIGHYFVHLPEMFPRALEYLLSNGLMATDCSRFYIDTNAIECLRNFSCECLDLFYPELIYSTLRVCETVLMTVPPNYGDKLVEAIMTLLAKLPKEEVIPAQRKVLSFVLTELQASTMGSGQGFTKGVLYMSAAFAALSDSISSEVWNGMSDVILSGIEQALLGLSSLNLPENAANTVYVLLKRAIKVVSVFADCFFPSACDVIVRKYVPGKEEGMTVIVAGVSLLHSEEHTGRWIQANYRSLMELLARGLEISPAPDTICTFFDLQSKMYEAGVPAFNDTLDQVLNLASRLIAFIHDRSSAKSLLSFCCLVFAAGSPVTGQHAAQIVKALVSALGTISSNANPVLANLMNAIKLRSSYDFANGVAQGLGTEPYEKMTANEKERLLHCFVNTDVETIQPIKQLISIVGNLLKGQATFDSVIAVEIGISSKSTKRAVIDLSLG
jgi:hypothetical protein